MLLGSSYLEKDQRNWDDDLQLLASAIRSTVNRQKGFTPNMIMHGREVLQPVDVMLGTAEANLSNLFPHEYVNHLAHTLPQLYEFVRTNLQSTQARQKRDYDVRIKESSYDVGDLVYLLDSATNIGQSKKLRSPWKGPYLIVKVLSNILFRIRGQRGDSVIHHDRLKLYESTEIALWVRRARHNMEVDNVNKDTPGEVTAGNGCPSRGMFTKVGGGTNC